MRRVVLLALLALALPVAASATTCSAGLGISAGVICSLGDLTFDFTSVSSLPPGDILSLIAGTGILPGGDVNLEFQVGPTFPVDMTLNYTVTSTSTDITGIDAGYVGVSEGDTLVEVACGSAFVGPSCSNVLASLSVPGPNTNIIKTFGAVSTVFIDKDFSTKGNSSFSDSILQPVPEPGTLGMLGTGLIGLAGLVRRKLAR